MTRHIIDRGILATIHAFDGGGCVVLSRDGALADYTVTRGTACALASSGLLGADVEVALSRAGETTPADGERARYLAASADVARLERELADAESARDRHALRARLLADGILDVAAGRPLDARLDGIDADNLRALAAHLDAQRPHGPAADVERVVIAEGEVVAWGGSSTSAFVGAPRFDDGDDAVSYGILSGSSPALRPHVTRRARVVVELLPAAAVDAQDGVGEQRGEGVGQSGVVEHGASVATAAAPVKSRDGGAA